MTDVASVENQVKKQNKKLKQYATLEDLSNKLQTVEKYLYVSDCNASTVGAWNTNGEKRCVKKVITNDTHCIDSRKD